MTQKIHMHKIFQKKKALIPVLLYKSGIICIFLLFFFMHYLATKKLMDKSKYCDITSL